MPLTPEYALYYWPSIQGRGEFVRLALEAAGAEYIDVARLPKGGGHGVPALMKGLKGEMDGPLPFAPPFLVHGALVIAQTANILQYLAPRLGLVPDDEASRLAAHQYQLTIADIVNEAHDVHHPIAVSLYYEDQKAEALRRARAFTSERMPKYLSYFDRVLDRNVASEGRHLVGTELSYVDLSLFQLVSGLEYAFPKAMKRVRTETPRVRALAQHVVQHPRIGEYLASERRLAFNEEGIFRHYPELDL